MFMANLCFVFSLEIRIHFHFGTLLLFLSYLVEIRVKLFLRDCNGTWTHYKLITYHCCWCCLCFFLSFFFFFWFSNCVNIKLLIIIFLYGCYNVLLTINGLIQLLILRLYFLKMVTGKCNQNISIFLENVYWSY